MYKITITALCFLLLSACVALTPVEKAVYSTNRLDLIRYAESNPKAFEELGNFSTSGTYQNGLLLLCEAYISSKMYQQYEKCMKEANTLYSRINMPYAEAELFMELEIWTLSNSKLKGMDALVAYDLGDFAKAKKIANKWYWATVNLGPEEDLTGFDINALSRVAGLSAILAAREGDLESAEIFLATLEGFDPSDSDNQYYQVGDIQNEWLAKVYLSMNRPQDAYEAVNEISFGLEAAKLLHAVLINIVDLAYEGSDLAGLYDFREIEMQALSCQSLMGIKRYIKAKECFLSFSKTPVVSGFGGLKFSSLYNLGIIASKEKDWHQANIYFKEAIELLEEQRSSIAIDGHKIGFLKDRMSIYGEMVHVQQQLGQTKIALEYVERAKSRALVDLLASKKQFGSQPQVTELLAKMEQEEIADLSVRPDGTRSIRGLKRTVREQYSELSSLTTVQSLAFDTLTKPLKSDETLIEFFSSDEQWYVFVVDNNAVHMQTLPLKNIEEKVQQFRQKINETNTTSYLMHAEALYEDLLAPISQYIKHSNVTIVAHGALHYLPFAALHDGQGFIVDNYTLRLLPSMSVLKYLPEPDVSKVSLAMLALGNPDLGNIDYALPGAEQEVIALTKQTKNSRLLLNANATETAVRENGGKANILHIASHGEFDPKTPLNSRLLLAADSKNDGSLTVGDIYNLDLNADLVTLSACETGLGEIQTGDDVIGLTRGFIYAGTKSVVSSLWTVDDKATEALMLDFYHRLEQPNNNKAQSLRAAQLTIRNNYNEHPFYWAAFQLTGSR